MIREIPPVDYGYVCDTCGLSDAGLERLRSLGFDRRPCLNCSDHFGAANGAGRLVEALNRKTRETT